jgi:flagellar biosynthesis/type III secretory pathway chaperone
MNNPLADVLTEQIRCAEAMLQTLGRESEALVAGDAELLGSVGAEKARLVESLETLEIERRTLSTAAGDEAGDRGSPQWQALLGLISACKDRNQRNGALVKARSEQVHIALQALRGSEPGFYDPNGLKPSARSARPLGTA